MRLNGRTYEYIAGKAGVSRQRIQQLLSPPSSIRKYIIKKYNGCCDDCGIFVGKSGHVHHKPANGEEDYNDIENLQLLCLSCHRIEHSGGRKDKSIDTNQLSNSGRDTLIIPIRVKIPLFARIDEAVKSSRKPSRNAWLIWAINNGLRKHSKKAPDHTG